MRRLCIVFGDNDFYSTWLSVLNALGWTLQQSGDDILSFKEPLVDVLSNMAYPHYLLHQYRWDMEGKWNQKYPPKDTEHLKEYFRLDASQVLLDDEVTEFMNSENFFSNGEYFVLDFNPHTDYCKAYCI